MAERAHEQLPDSVLVDWLVATIVEWGTARGIPTRLEHRKGSRNYTNYSMVPPTLRTYRSNGIKSRQHGNTAISLDYKTIIHYKSHGFSDAYIADALNGFKPQVGKHFQRIAMKTVSCFDAMN